ncbi:hypothetical protein [Meiothermus taiwanensis]|jgi:hypothetical protein|uniref:Uncharacterized protein n=1 Tax=Meiothermus taiwanensis WR-220 TaxID=1339250 RepID=A0ABM6WJL7_9DEIN|nr:hypothetical protein [Meiothermus taiwanensis]AWR87066.1 hypothetical protein Mtai_v1c18320 [Meiothermus taiwanensis WR-220]KZK16142.1 hypothetical protein A3962_07555 [Meiothermus taiwanensis]
MPCSNKLGPCTPSGWKRKNAGPQPEAALPVNPGRGHRRGSRNLGLRFGRLYRELGFGDRYRGLRTLRHRAGPYRTSTR